MRFIRSVTSIFLGCIGVAYHANKSSITAPAENSDSISESSSTTTDRSRMIKLNDGRYLAYKEIGVPKNKSDYRVIIIHGFGSSKEMNFMVSQELMDELKIYVLLYDRAGYGESDPHPKRTIKSEASDIQQLADQMELGHKFYVVAVSLGSYPAWSCLKTIPQRLAGVAMVVPMINYNWPSLPKHLIEDDFRRNLSRWTLMAANHTPRLLHWWLTQKWLPFPSSVNVLDKNPTFFSNKDLEVLSNTQGFKLLSQVMMMISLISSFMSSFLSK
ncbi:uncharacterized protein LOC124920506 [Impatiens glandulifera]|uniref:uncharacterized protein LOC124920506 n=1 Tax=Impatiens glandulifera TaxID=253017 RepID=UPI001FB19264|nr:uncharacterized protein LOC124920506 [Impatiens glandulifera]